MGTKKARPQGGKKGPTPIYAGHYGTIEDMVVNTITDSDGMVTVVAEDGDGFYLTTEVWIGKKMADPNRTSTRRYASMDEAIVASM